MIVTEFSLYIFNIHKYFFLVLQTRDIINSLPSIWQSFGSKNRNLYTDFNCSSRDIYKISTYLCIINIIAGILT